MAQVNATRVEQMFGQLQENIKNLTEQLQIGLNDTSQSIRKLEEKLFLEIQEVRQENLELKTKIRELEQANQIREDRDRRNNLVVFGIPRQAKESWESIEREICNFTKFYFRVELDENDIVRAHRVGQQQNSPIVVKFTNFKLKEYILKKGHLLKNTPYKIFEDFSLPTRQERKLLLQEAAKIRRETEGNVRCRVSYRTLRVNGISHEVKDGKIVKKGDRSKRDEFECVEESVTVGSKKRPAVSPNYVRHNQSSKFPNQSQNINSPVESNTSFESVMEDLQEDRPCDSGPTKRMVLPNSQEEDSEENEWVISQKRGSKKTNGDALKMRLERKDV